MRDRSRGKLTKTELEILSLLAGRPEGYDMDGLNQAHHGGKASAYTKRCLSVHLTHIRKKLACQGITLPVAHYRLRFTAEDRQRVLLLIPTPVSEGEQGELPHDLALTTS